jgi:protein-S-isoprenylcysteine O-methyltransferase Ste14
VRIVREALGWAITVVLCGWAVAEVALQTWQFVRRGTTERSEHRTLIATIVLVAGAMALAKPIARAVPALSYPTHSVGLRAVVLVVGLAGIAFRLWAIVSLGRFFRGTVHIQTDHEVVRSGPYRWVRHPSYSGALLAAFAFEVLTGNVLAALVAAAGCAIACAYRIRVEERMLAESLGDAYTSYASVTSRLIPRVW